MTRVAERIVVLDGSVPFDAEIVGGKGASVARMRSLGLPVPPAFVLPVDECRRYHAGGRRLDEEALAERARGSRRARERNSAAASGIGPRRSSSPSARVPR